MIDSCFQTIGYKVRHSGYFPRKAISYSLSSLSSVQVTEPAKKILFDGFDDSILSILNLASFGEIKDKFGLFYGVSFLRITSRKNLTMINHKVLLTKSKEYSISIHPLSWTECNAI